MALSPPRHKIGSYVFSRRGFGLKGGACIRQIQETRMGARNMNARKKKKRLRHKEARDAHREKLGATAAPAKKKAR